MNKTRKLQATAAVVAILVALSGYAHAKRRRQDHRAARLLQAIETANRPGSAGAMAVEALDIHYAERVANGTAGRVVTMPPEKARELAKKIYGAWGWFDDDEEAVYSALREAKDKVQVSQVANAYQHYPHSLADDLYRRLSREELAKALAIVNAKPPYRTA